MEYKRNLEIANNGKQLDYNITATSPIKFNRSVHYGKGPIVREHWHEEFMMVFIEQGEAIVYCNLNRITAGPEDLVVINSNEIHYIESKSDMLVFYTIKIDFSHLLSNQIDLVNNEYVNLLIHNQIRFYNNFPLDSELKQGLDQLIIEYNRKDKLYELAVKDCIYHILVLMMRHHIESIANVSNEKKQPSIFNDLQYVLEFVDKHYNQELSLDEIATMANMNKYHFCRIFKKTTGKSLTEYVNYIRINTAVELLKEGNMNISEISNYVGFNDSNYFSRVFKKYKNIAPTKILTIKWGDIK